MELVCTSHRNDQSWSSIGVVCGCRHSFSKKRATLQRSHIVNRGCGGINMLACSIVCACICMRCRFNSHIDCNKVCARRMPIGTIVRCKLRAPVLMHREQSTHLPIDFDGTSRLLSSKARLTNWWMKAVQKRCMKAVHEISSPAQKSGA